MNDRVGTSTAGEPRAARLVLHVIPYHGIGGVEAAAETAEGASDGGVRISRLFIFENIGSQQQRGDTWNPLAFWRAAGRLVARSPDLIVLSLWRSIIVAILARLRGFRGPAILFLHNARDAHALDRILTRFAARRVSAIWADSRVSLENRLPFVPKVPTRVISFHLENLPVARMEKPDPTPRLVFWGRIAEQKQPLRMIDFLERLGELVPDAHLTIIGPDGGQLAALKGAIASRGLERCVDLTGPATRGEIAAIASRSSFYLQTSRYEGMAIAVSEAMQLGLVPVVTPVGEISRYTNDGEDAIWIGSREGEVGDADIADAAEKVAHLVAEPERWRAMRAAATTRFAGRKEYRTDILDAARNALKGINERTSGEGL